MTAAFTYAPSANWPPVPPLLKLGDIMRHIILSGFMSGALLIVSCDRQPSPPRSASSPSAATSQAPAQTGGIDPAKLAALRKVERAPDEVFQPGVKSHANPSGIENKTCPVC